MVQKSQEFKKVAECLYRNGNGIYFALVKVARKQVRRSLKTNDVALAKRRLAEFRGKAKRQTDHKNRDIRFEELAELWLASIKARSNEHPTPGEVWLWPVCQNICEERL